MWYAPGMFIINVFKCRACGAVLPQAGREPRRVQLWRWVCSPACSIDYLAAAAGLDEPDNASVPGISSGHRRNNMDSREAPVMLDNAGALPGGVLHDYRGEVDRIVDAITPRNLDGFRGA